MGKQAPDRTGFLGGEAFLLIGEQMEEQYSCDEDEWEGQEPSSPLHVGARWSGQVSENSDTSADQSVEVKSRTSGISTGSRNSKTSNGRESVTRMSSKAENGSYHQLTGDEEETEDVREEGNVGSDKYALPRRVSGGSFMGSSSVGWETSSQAARSILGGIFNNLPVTGESREGSQELEVSQHNEPEADKEEEDMDEEEEDPHLEVAMRMKVLDKEHKSFSERMTDWISNVSLKQKEAEDEDFNHFGQARSKQPEEAAFENRSSNKSDITLNLDEKQEDDHKHSTSTSFLDVDCNMGNTDRVSTKSSRAQSFNGSTVGIEEEENWMLGGEKEMLSQRDEELRNKFHCDQSQRGIAYSMIPSLAFSSYEKGFAKAQMTNGRQLFDNGLIRQRSAGSRVRSLPFPEAQPQYKKVVETMEQHMVVDADGTQRVDTKHRREEESSKGSVHRRSWCSNIIFLIGSFSLLLLCLFLVYIVVPNQHSVELRRCLLQEIQGLPQEP